MRACFSRCLLAIVWLMFAGRILADEPAESLLASLDKQIAADNFDSALAEARRAVSSLPLSAKLTAWEHDFRGEVVHVAPGKECLYYQLSVANSRRDAPGRENPLPTVTVNHSRSDWNHIIVCLDLIGGEIRWSRGVNGLVNLGVASRTDDLYLWRERLLRLDATTGDVTLQRELPSEMGRASALLLGHRLALSKTVPDDFVELTRDDLLTYDPKRDVAKRRSPSDFFLLAPDESHRLTHEESVWSCVDISRGTTTWRRPDLNLSYPPLWDQEHLVLYEGNEWSHGTISAIQVETGQPVWTTRLGWGAYSIGHHQLAGGGYPNEAWTPLGRAGNLLVALDGSGRVVLLDAESGEIRASAALCRNHLHLPQRIEETLVVTSFDWVRAFPLATLLAPMTNEEAAIRMREAESLLGMKRSDDALATLDHVVARVPDHSRAWAFRAEICLAKGLQHEASFSLCRAMAIEGRTHDPVLRDNWGLVRLFNLESRPAWEVVPLREHALTGTQAGQLWSIQLDSLEPRVRRLPHEVMSLTVEHQLSAVLGDSRHSKKAIEELPMDEPRDPEIPREWWTMGGEKRIGAAVSHEGRQFRPIKNGGVRILERTRIQELPGRLDGVGIWKIHDSPWGPIGYGEGGVFELDEDLRPVRFLYRPRIGGEVPQHVKVQYLRDTERTLGLVVASDRGSALQICGRDDGQLIAETRLGGFISGFSTPGQLIPLGHGYLFSDRQLHWVGSDAKVWSFGPPTTRTSTDRHGDRWRYFGTPTVEHGFLFVTSLDGHLLVFDTARITHPK